jgi:hypothetical protein
MMDLAQQGTVSDQEPLEVSFPAGMFSADESPGSLSAARMLRIIEKMIQESSAHNALLGRYALLQTFPRLEEVEESRPARDQFVSEAVPDILRQYCKALCPNSFVDVFDSFSELELEVFLKSYLHAHETWGHHQGVATLVRTMLESCTHYALPVIVRGLEGQECVVPDDLISHLGREKQFSFLGKNFLLGRRVVVRPPRYDVLVGPISIMSLESLQRGGWAEDTTPSQKLYQLIELAEPFYLRAKIHFLFEKSGFILNSAVTGSSRLGLSGDMTNERIQNLAS